MCVYRNENNHFLEFFLSLALLMEAIDKKKCLVKITLLKNYI